MGRRAVTVGTAFMLTASLAASVPAYSDTDPSTSRSVVYIDRVSPSLPSVATSQAAIQGKKAKKAKVRKKKLLAKIKKMKPDEYTSCTVNTCYTYTYVLKTKCVDRILKKGRFFCSPWKQVTESKQVDDPDDGEWGDDPSNDSCTAGPTVCLPDGEPVAQPGSRSFIPGVNAIPDLGIPTGSPTDFSYLFGSSVPYKFGRCESKKIYVRTNYDAVPAAKREITRLRTERALQTVADKSGYTIVIQGGTPINNEEDARREQGNLNNDTDIHLFFYEPQDVSSSILGRAGALYDGAFLSLVGGFVSIRSVPIVNQSDSHWYESVENGSVYATVMHEFGHSLGLGHSQFTYDPATMQIMNPMADPMVYTQFQAGDRTGLNEVGPNTPCQEWS